MYWDTVGIKFQGSDYFAYDEYLEGSGREA